VNPGRINPPPPRASPLNGRVSKPLDRGPPFSSFVPIGAPFVPEKKQGHEWREGARIGDSEEFVSDSQGPGNSKRYSRTPPPQGVIRAPPYRYVRPIFSGWLLFCFSGQNKKL
jgi:hypothetical protein